jgi:hypothetical protein
MRTAFLKALPAAALLTLVVGLGAVQTADCPSCNISRRGDRREGVKTNPVSGGSLTLLAVEYRPAGATGSAGPDMHVYFWLPQPESAVIEVWDPVSNYWMAPDERPLGRSLQAYTWPRKEVLEPLGLGAADLFLKVRNRDKTLYYPALVSAGPKPAPGGGYTFAFDSGAGLDVLCTVSRDEGGTLVPVRKFPFSEEMGGTFRISWDGRDDQGRPAPAGSYVLKVKGKTGPPLESGAWQSGVPLPRRGPPFPQRSDLRWLLGRSPVRRHGRPDRHQPRRQGRRQPGAGDRQRPPGGQVAGGRGVQPVLGLSHRRGREQGPHRCELSP